MRAVFTARPIARQAALCAITHRAVRNRNRSRRGTTLLAALLAATLGISAQARDPSPTCEELEWSAQMLENNPDIREACQGVYVKGDTYYAKISIEISAARNNRLTFRPILANGTRGKTRSITVESSWRANIDGRSLRVGQLQSGQRLSIYVPEDRFAPVDLEAGKE